MTFSNFEKVMSSQVSSRGFHVLLCGKPTSTRA
nr:MAG TPA: hypothetical protein [Caudoviricetes sp.]